MPLDRQAIEKRDFPIGRRGYDPAAVDAHLARLADEFDAVQRQAKRRSGDSLAQASSDRVRSIVEAAESSAQAIERSAEEEAQQVRVEAATDAERTRADAVERSQDHIGRVSQATAQMLERVEAMQQELAALTDTLRTGTNRVNADLSLLVSNMGELYAAAGGEREQDAVLERPAEVDAFDDEPEIEDEPLATVPATPEPVAAAPDDSAAPAAHDDVEGARIIALNMALNGQSREETDRYLADNFALAEREQLLDEVYESIGG